jgi:hypothetical protein
MGVLYLVLLVVFVAGVAYARRRADVVIALAGGQATLERGRVPPVLLHDLAEVSRFAPGVEGRVKLRGKGDGLDLELEGLDESMEQRVRNAVMLHRGRL